jgi:hypothetical protein
MEYGVESIIRRMKMNVINFTKLVEMYIQAGKDIEGAFHKAYCDKMPALNNAEQKITFYQEILDAISNNTEWFSATMDNPVLKFSRVYSDLKFWTEMKKTEDYIANMDIKLRNIGI